MIMSRRKQSNPKPLLQKRDDEEAADEQQSLPQEQQTNSSSGSGSSSTTSNGSEAAPETDMINSRPPSNQIDSEEDPPVAQPPPTHEDSTLSPKVAPNSSRASSIASPPSAPATSTMFDPEPGADLSPPEKVEIKIEPDLLAENQHHSPEAVKDDENKSPELTSAQLPMLRLNIALASDPATNPDAKDLKNITAANDSQFEKSIESDFSGAAPQPAAVIRKTAKTESVTIPITVDLPPRIPMFMCGPCGIRFSSASTLEAHQTYYCSHRKDADETAGGVKNANSNDPNGSEPPAKAAKTGKQYACTQCSYSADKKVSLNRHMRMHQSSPAPSSNASNGDESTASQQLQLQFQAQAAAAAAAAAAVLQQQQQVQQQQQPPQVDRYCSDCDIRFSSTKTYRAHKQHYCSSRHREGQSNNSTPKPPQKSGSQSPPDASKTPPVAPQQPFLALPTNPIIVIPYSLIRGASVIPGLPSSLAPSIPNPESACFFFQNGTLQPIAVSLASATAAAAAAAASAAAAAASAAVSQQQQQQLQSGSLGQHSTPTQPNNSAPHSRGQTPNVGSEGSSSSNSTGEVLKAVNKRENIKESSTPLDLSVRRLSPGAGLRERSLSFSSAISVDQLRMDFDSLMEGKENLSVSGDSITPEQIVCAPSLPGSPPLTPSPKRRSNSPRGGGGSVGNIVSSRGERDGSVSISPLTLQQQQQQLLMRPLLPADIALRLSAADPALNLNLNILPNSQLLTKQGVELALRLSSTANSNSIDHASSKNSHPQQQMSPLLNSISPTTNNVQVPVLSSTPQIFVKQGDSKCKECNIVFCKYENYLAHKKHYCSARNLDGDGDNLKVSPPISPQAASPSNSAGNVTGGGAQRASGGGQPMAYQQLICAACGIKFTSLDNLSAHQMYYCPKRVDVQVPANVTPQKERCSKCKSLHEPGQPCTVAGQGAYKCPICEAISPNSTEARRHMDTHGGVKAFRCTICRYKGNTLRGMRTHIRMHFDKKSNDFNEENYITCILEEDGIEIPPAAAVASAAAAAAAAAAQLMNQAAAAAQVASQQTPSLPPPLLIGAGEKLNPTGQMQFCELCPYYSSYKINVAQHIKLVHGRERPPNNSPLIGEGGESLIFNGDSGSSTPRPPVSSTPGPTGNSFSSVKNSGIKSEPEDDRTEDPDVDVDVVMEEPEVIIKTEATDSHAGLPMGSPAAPPSLVPSQSHSLKLKSLPTAIAANSLKSSPNHTSLAKTPSPPSFLGDINHSGPNYCAPCDITFNYVNTYIAHKKFYCKNSQQEGGGTPAAVGAPASIRAATSGSPNNVVSVTRATETSV
ncbi:zinc finger protein ush isoform X2 [Wyeomyia smithii]|uniref:zinc finger protein ush isoform X2 n=2 Tax=Wyeomyia smithii TaxID=174621 RepID=UPI002468051F|nr:zinc finger protein ush isoform X2 [Wyeomyia smithii]